MKEKVMSVVLAFLLASGFTTFTCSAESTETQEPTPALSEFETASVYWIFYKAPDTSKIEETAEQQRQEYINELYRSGATEKEVEQKSTEYYKEVRLNYLKETFKEAAEQVLTDIGADPSKAWCSSYTATIVCELDDEQLAKARASALITDISAYTQPDLTPETPAFSNSEEFIDLLTKDENGNSVLPTDIKVDAALDCSNNYYNIDYLIIYGLNSVKEIKNVIDCLNKQTKYHWENTIEDYSGCEYLLFSENTLSKNVIRIAIFVDNSLPGFLEMSPSAYSDVVGFDVTPYIFYLGDANGDARIDATDSSKILSLYSTLSTTSDYEITDEEKKTMDVNLDGNVDASDASQVLSFYSYVSTGGSKNIKEFLSEDK